MHPLLCPPREVRAVARMRHGRTGLNIALLLLSLAACSVASPPVAKMCEDAEPWPSATPLPVTDRTSGVPYPYGVPSLLPVPTSPTSIPPPTPIAPLSRLLPQVGPHALLYTTNDRHLMLLDLD